MTQADQLRERIRTEAPVAREKGEKIFAEILPKLQKRKRGGFVGINVENGKYVVSKDEVELHRRYKRAFGGALGWIRSFEGRG